MAKAAAPLMKVKRIADDEAFEAEAKRICARSDGGEGAQGLDAKLKSVQEIVDGVKKRGDAAVTEYTAKFDGVNLRAEMFEMTSREIDAAVKSVDIELLDALKRAHKNIETFHSKHLRASWQEKDKDGTVVGQRITPVESAGLYVPGGKAFYPSSVLMNIVPARVAGVKDIVMVSPPSHKGGIHPLVLAAARVAGATRVFRVGGAQAIAALAYGTKRIPAVAKIAGPGNIFVTLAKRIVSSVCDIDKEAGPSEVVVIADDSADPRLVAIELLAQAEHDEEAMAVLVCISDAMSEKVQAAMNAEMKTLSRSEIIKKSLQGQGRVYVVRSIEEAAKLTNVIAPEHLSIQTKDPDKVLEKIQNVGCAILGGGTSVAVGDYYAGPNHILPTGRRARFSSPLTAEDFRKVTSIISYSPARIKKAAPDIIKLAEAEELTAHARALELRS
jgi:histidinol dehydrogenase